jgi:uroporphyrinogen decarboxylase
VAKKAGPMTDKERVEALLKRQKPDRVPIWPFALGFAAVYTKTSIADAYNNPKVALDAQRKTCQDFGWVFLPMIAYAARGGWEFGGDIKWPDGKFAQAPTVARYPVETPEDAMNLRMPDVKNSGIIPLTMEFYRWSWQENLDNKPFNVLCPMGAPFSLASNISGPDKFVKWLLKKPEAAQRLLRLASDYIIEVAQYYKGTYGTDGVLPWGAEPISSNYMIAPKHFEMFVLPYLKEVHEKVLAMGYKTILFHICGEHNRNLPYWAKVPMGNPGLISFGHEIDLETAASYFPNDIIVGNLQPVIIQAGTPEEVYEASRRVIEKGKKLPCGFIFAPGCEMPPNAPLENVQMMTKAANDFGWYD